MNGFMAKNPKQLDLCLRLLYAEHVSFLVDITENNKKKLIYSITADADEPKIKELQEKYRILIS